MRASILIAPLFYANLILASPPRAKQTCDDVTPDRFLDSCRANNSAEVRFGLRECRHKLNEEQIGVCFNVAVGGEGWETVHAILDAGAIDPTAQEVNVLNIARMNGQYLLVHRLLQDERVREAVLDGTIYIPAEIDLNQADSRRERNVLPLRRIASKEGYAKLLKFLMEDKHVEPTRHKNAAIKYASRRGHFRTVAELYDMNGVDFSPQQIIDEWRAGSRPGFDLTMGEIPALLSRFLDYGQDHIGSVFTGDDLQHLDQDTVRGIEGHIDQYQRKKPIFSREQTLNILREMSPFYFQKLTEHDPTINNLNLE